MALYTSSDRPSDVESLSDSGRRQDSLAFRLRGVSAKIDRREVFQDLDLDLGKSRTTVILGPGGSGKSTLLRVLAETSPADKELRMPADEGTGEFKMPPPLSWAGECACGVPTVRLMRQRHALRSRLVILELATAWGLPHDLAGIEEARSKAAQVWRPVSGAWEFLRPVMNKNFGDLSSGLQRLVDLTLVAAGEPHCLLLDEPTSEQNLPEESLVVQYLESLRGRCTLVVVTHNVRLARLIGDDLVLFIGGKVTEAGPLQQVWNDPQHPRTEFFLRMGC